MEEKKLNTRHDALGTQVQCCVGLGTSASQHSSVQYMGQAIALSSVVENVEAVEPPASRTASIADSASTAERRATSHLPIANWSWVHREQGSRQLLVDLVYIAEYF